MMQAKIWEIGASEGTDVRGKNMDTISRRLYGKKAFFESNIPQSPESGRILVKTGIGQYDVKAIVLWCEEK